MIRSPEDMPSASPDPHPPKTDAIAIKSVGPDADQSEPVDFPSLETIRGELIRRADLADSSKTLLFERLPGNALRRDCLSRVHFRVSAENRTLFRLTVGRNLTQLWERTQALASACPEITCRPLFLQQAGGWDYLAVEYFDGCDLQTLVLNGRLTPAEAAHHGGRIVSVLEKTLLPSSGKAAAQELDTLFASVEKLPVFAGFDYCFLRDAVFPFVRAGALIEPFRTRWTNGDLTPKNVLADQEGNLRLIDCEFAARTHFFAEDGWRWHRFSSLPAEARDLPGASVVETKKPWIEAFCFLRQLSLVHDISEDSKAALDTAAVIDRLSILADELNFQLGRSLILQRLAMVPELTEAVQKNKRAIVEKDQAIAEKDQTIAEKDQTIAETLALGRAVTSHALGELARLRDLLYQREEKIRAMQASFSWQSTAPLRALRRTLLDRNGPKQAPLPDPARFPSVNFPYLPRDFEPATTHFCYSFDRPRSWNMLAGQVEVQGWCFTFDRVPLNAVRARVGDRIFPGIYGQPRSDVATRYPQYPQAKPCGFKIELTLEPKDNLVVIEVGDEQASWHRIFTRCLGGNIPDENYSRWIRAYDTLTPETIVQIKKKSQSLKRRPLISVLMPVYNTPEKWLARAVESVRTQIYEQWELCIADDASTEPHVRPLLEKAAREDSRIKVVFRETNGHISAASNSALELSSGEFTALLDHDDELAPHALLCCAKIILADAAAEVIYSDEDKIDKQGFRFDPHFKPDWNPDLLTSQNYFSHLSAYRTATLRAIGGFRNGLEGSQDWDVALRMIERVQPQHIHHIPRVLYHWRAIDGSTAVHRDEKNYASISARKTLEAHFIRTGPKASLRMVHGGHWHVQYPRPEPPPLVTLIIPTRNGRKLLATCVESIFARTSYPSFEILVADNGSDDPELIAFYELMKVRGRFNVLPCPGPFNFSAINNRAVKHANGEIIGLLNNDLEIIHPEWLDEMVSHAVRTEIGAVGAKLYYPDFRIQHAGVITGLGGVAGHAFKYLPRHEPGIHFRPHLVHNTSAVTAACLVIRKAVYLEVGGFDENIAVAFNDVDFCLKVQSLGYRNLYTPFAELIHHESASRGLENSPEKIQRFQREIEYIKARWGERLLNDPAYNPNFSLDTEDFAFAYPPRVPGLGEPGPV
jgi:glycosyltransferase involved in cell wall biosynthesis